MYHVLRVAYTMCPGYLLRRKHGGSCPVGGGLLDTLRVREGEPSAGRGPEGGVQREVERLVGAFRAYSPKCVEYKFSEVHIQDPA